VFRRRHGSDKEEEVREDCRLGGVVVSVLATGPNGRGFGPGQGDGFLRAIKSAAHLPLGWELNPETFSGI
jgi:hypothetical protein